MTTSVQPEGVRGTVEPGFEPVIDRLRESVAADPSFAGTLCVYHHGRRVLDLWWGPGTEADELLPVFSSSKGAAGIVIACLLRDGLVDLNSPVADLWPEFAACGKAAVPVRQLLSHQAGLLGVAVELVVAVASVHAEQAGLMAEQLAHRHRRLAAGGELGPQVGDRRI